MTDDHAADLCRVREVHDVVNNLRRLLLAAARAEEAGGVSRSPDPGLQSATGR